MSTKADKEVISLLNQCLTGELTAINQYFIHARMCKDWGYERLAAIVERESIDEMKHAGELVDRILYLGGIPNLQRLNKVNVGETVREQFELDLELEREGMARLGPGIDLLRQKGDHGSRMLLERILASEEEHIDWLESQLHLIEQIGEANYLAQQVLPE